MQNAKLEKSRREWPNDPYKGLTSYGYDDVPLFAGRDTDVRRVGRILGAGSTRILLLHGPTGCGKSSFLRAGLIPFLENQIGRFRFARDTAQGADTALFVRATHDPLLELASRLYESASKFVETPREELVPLGKLGNQLAGRDGGSETGESESTQLVAHLREYPTAAAFTSAVADDPERLVDLIGRLGYARPRTQVLVVDQAEEVLTLRPNRDGDVARRRFFQFLAYLSHNALDFRLIVAFRTEYHGRFYAMLKGGGTDATALEDYYLAELAGPDLLDAIMRPTSPDNIAGYGIPRKTYRFYYEQGLPQTIVADLAKTPLAGGILPVLQIVCRRLYQKAQNSPAIRGYRVIRHKDYRELGGIQGQIDLHLQQALSGCCAAFNLRLLRTKLETVRWRDVLSGLAKPQADGSVTTDVKPAKILCEVAALRGCKMPFGKVMDFLQQDEWRIVRPVELTKMASNEKVPCYSLGHDVLGAVLERWREARKKDRTGLRTALGIWGVIIGLLFWLLPRFLDPRVALGYIPRYKVAGVVVGFCVFLLAWIPDSRRFRFLYRPVYGYASDLRSLRRLVGARTAEP